MPYSVRRVLRALAPTATGALLVVTTAVAGIGAPSAPALFGQTAYATDLAVPMQAGTVGLWPGMISGSESPPLPAVVMPTSRNPRLPDGTQIEAPYRTQFDGTTWAGGNCGVASIGIAIGRFGYVERTDDLRRAINNMSGDWSVDSGVAWRYLQQAVEERGFATEGLYAPSGGYRVWTMDDLLAETRAGRPVILLMRYKALPGHENAQWYGDHYIVFLGMTSSGNVVYHDPAFHGAEGRYRTVDQATFEQAWERNWSGLNRTAMAIYPQQ